MRSCFVGAQAFMVASVVVVGIAVAVVTQLSSITLGRNRSNWRDTSNCVANVWQREDVDVVLTEDWQAKPLMLLHQQSRLVPWSASIGVVAVNGLIPWRLLARSASLPVWITPEKPNFSSYGMPRGRRSLTKCSECILFRWTVDNSTAVSSLPRRAVPEA